VDVTTSPVGLATVTVTYESATYPSSTTPPTDAGSYTVTATLDNANYTADPATGTLVIGKANQSITFDGPADKTFGDAPFTVSATATSGLAVTFGAAGNCSVDGDEVTITGAGSCTITASQAGDGNWNAAAPQARSFTINKATATLTLDVSDLSQTYGATRAVDVTTSPVGLATVTVTYESATYPSSTTPPTDAGSYTVTATLDNANYTADPATGTLVIGKAATTTVITCPASVSFTGSALVPCSATVTGPNLSAPVTVTYANNTNPGTATADATYAGGPNHLGSTAVQKTFQIVAATATLTLDAADLSQTYGATRAVDVTTTPRT
jgi:trimeric autotransporter adhesin